jgi:hypothetical protein
MTTQHTDEMREAFTLFKETLTPSDLRHYTAWQLAEMCHAAGVLHGLKSTTRYQDALREATNSMKAAEELLIYDGYTSPQATAKKVLVNTIATINKLLGEK